MIVDLILDRKYEDELISQGYTHSKKYDGTLVPLAYDPHKFYQNLVGYIGGCGGKDAEAITRAMDLGTEEDVKQALCNYITRGGEYNPAICDYIRSRNWLTPEGEDVKNAS